jgi:hypothetical protein
MYREVTMLEVKEVLRLWREGVPTKRLAAQLRLDPKAVRRYLRAAAAAGVRADGTAVTDDDVREVLLSLQPVGGRPRGDGRAQCETQREAIRRWLADGLRLTKIRKLLLRQGVGIAYPTLYRFAVLEQFRAEDQPVLRPAPTTPYDIPLWSEPKVARDQLASAGKATCSMPHRYVGQVVTARADSHLVRFYARGLLIQDASAAAPGRPVDRRLGLSGRAQHLCAPQAGESCRTGLRSMISGRFSFPTLVAVRCRMTMLGSRLGTVVGTGDWG